MTSANDPTAWLTRGQVAQLLGMSLDTVGRIPVEQLEHWSTPGDPEREGSKGHRRYRRADVNAYAGAVQKRDISGEPNPPGRQVGKSSE